MADPKTILPQYDSVIQTLRKNGVSYAGLFGSHVTGTAKVGSDYDFLIQYPPSASVSLLDVARLTLELEEVLQAPVDVVEKDTISPYLKPYILPTVIPLYG